jgi:hypothetical protein
MVYCDSSASIIEWGSEEIIIPYLSPWDGKKHRYYPDFYIKVKRHERNNVVHPIQNHQEKLNVGSLRLKHGESMKQSGNMQTLGVWIMVWNLKY